MTLHDKTVAVLGGTRISCEIVRAAKRLGLKTAVIDYNPPELSPAKGIADCAVNLSVADTDAVADWLIRHDVNGVITGYADSLLVWYAQICEKAGLPCYGNEEQFRIFTDKRRWKSLCGEHGVPSSSRYPVEDALKDPLSLRFPVMVKPADGSGSRGVSVVRRSSGIASAVEVARSYSRAGEVLVEEYLEGPELTMMWIVIDGRAELFMAGDRLMTGGDRGALPLPYGYAFPSRYLPACLGDFVPKAKEMLRSTGVRNGMMFMQCIVRDGIPHVYDIGYRLTGTLEHHLTEVVAGYSPMDMLLRYAVTGSMTDDPDIFEKIAKGLISSCFNASCLMEPGTIGHFEGIGEVLSMDGIAACVKAHVEGETLPESARGQLAQIALRVLGGSSGYEEAVEQIGKVQSAIRIIDPHGADLMLRP